MTEAVRGLIYELVPEHPVPNQSRSLAMLGLFIQS